MTKQDKKVPRTSGSIMQGQGVWLQSHPVLWVWLVFLLFSASFLRAQSTWTFDCDQQGWGTRSHSNNFEVSYLPVGASNPSGKIVFRHTGDKYENWLFAPVKNRVDADRNKHVWFSMELAGEESIHAGGINALFVWISDSVAGTLRTKTFKIFSGNHIYHLDLSSDANWRGIIEISRFHFPSGDMRPNGYNPGTAIYSMDWIVCNNELSYTGPEQDISKSCKPYSKPVLSRNAETVVFGTSFSLKTSQISGGLGNMELKYQVAGEPVKAWNYGSVTDGTLYASLSFLKPSARYDYTLKISNLFGSDSLSGSFTTEPEENYDLLKKNELWFTPSPFAPDVNSLFTEGGMTWKLDRVKNRGFHVREDQVIPSAGNFSQVDVRAMIFQLTKRRMHLSMEASGLLPGEANTVQSVADASVKKALQVLDRIYSQGGKLDYLSPDCIIKRVTGLLPNYTANLTMEQAFDAAALYFTGIHQKYSNIRIGYLVNLPNWHFEYNGTMNYGTAGGSYTKKSGYTFDRVLDEISKRLAPLGEKIAFVENDNPYKPYYLSKSIGTLPGITLDNPAMLTAVEQYCHEHNMAYGLIFNSASGGGSSNQAYFNESMQFLADYLTSHSIPDFLTVESWYTYPDKTLPANEPYTFMYLLDKFEESLAEKLIPTGIPDNESSGFGIYPNPAGSFFRIRTPLEEDVSLKIYSLTGSLLDSRVVSGNQVVSHNLKDGIYLVSIGNGQAEKVFRLVIRH